LVSLLCAIGDHDGPLRALVFVTLWRLPPLTIHDEQPRKGLDEVGADQGGEGSAGH
jgi:hypothetical protein